MAVVDVQAVLLNVKTNVFDAEQSSNEITWVYVNVVGDAQAQESELLLEDDDDELLNEELDELLDELDELLLEEDELGQQMD